MLVEVAGPIRVRTGGGNEMDIMTIREMLDAEGDDAEALRTVRQALRYVVDVHDGAPEGDVNAEWAGRSWGLYQRLHEAEERSAEEQHQRRTRANAASIADGGWVRHPEEY